MIIDTGIKGQKGNSTTNNRNNRTAKCLEQKLAFVCIVSIAKDDCYFRCWWRICHIFSKYILDEFVCKTLLGSCRWCTERWYAFLCPKM